MSPPSFLSFSHKLEVTPLAYMKICRTLIDLDDEFLFIMLGEQVDKKTFRAKDIFIPYQEVTGASCNITERGLVEVSKRNDEIIGWGHSHCNFGAFHSPTDVDTGNAGCNLFPPFVSLTVAKTGKWDCRLFKKDKTEIDMELILPITVSTDKITKKVWKYDWKEPWYKKVGRFLKGGNKNPYADDDWKRDDYPYRNDPAFYDR